MHALAHNPAQVWVETELHQWLGAVELRQLQLARINALLQHAVARVPFYRPRFGAKTPELRTLEELAALPFLTKAEIQANLDSMQATDLKRDGWIKNATGGSTGEPLVFFRDPRAQLWVDAAKERFRRWMGYLNEDKLALIWGADRDFPPNVPANEKWLNVFNCGGPEIERFILELLRWQPRAIRGYAGSLLLVAQYIKSRGLPPVRPHAIEAAAETLTPGMRRDIEAAFGAPVFNFYGAREVSCIACENSNHDGLLVADDIRLVEIIREGRPAAPGEEGKIIVTDLVNYAMPLIRYEIGDVGIAPPRAPAGACPFTGIQHVVGRTANTITAPDGRLVHGEFFTHLFYHQPGIRTFQVRQSAAGDIKIHVVPDANFQPETVENIVAAVREHFGAGANVSWRTVPDIPATTTGKRLFTLSEIPVRFDRNGRLNSGSANSKTAVATESAAAPRPRARSSKPRILFLADRPGWAFDLNAHGIAEALCDEFDFRIDYVVQQPDLNAWPYDLLVVMFWGENYPQRFRPDPRKVIKQVSSHRWALEDQYGRLTSQQMVERHLGDAETVIVPSRRLQSMLAPFRETFLTPKGFDSAQFKPANRRRGPLQLGWVGNQNDPCKGLRDILLPAANGDFDLRVAGGDLTVRQMGNFYRSIDVLCVASTAEGDPRPLIEGMATGCFPVAVDVGIVPELVEHGRNGLIVGRRIESFQAAFQWCRCNLDYVRKAGLEHAPQLRKLRSWSAVAPRWREAFLSALEKSALPSATSSVRAAPAAEERAAVMARAFQAGYARAEWEAGQEALESVFRTATGSPQAPAGYNDAVTYGLCALRPHHKVVLDVGAWLGNFAMNAGVLNPDALVFALEPEPRNFAFLARRAPANVVPLRLAVAGRCGRCDIFISENSQGHTLYQELLNPSHARNRPVPVPTVTFAQLVNLVGGQVDFMKINAEGAEFDILSTPAFRQVAEAIVEVHLEGTDSRTLLAAVEQTHTVEMLEDRSPRFLFVHLRRKSSQ